MVDAEKETESSFLQQVGRTYNLPRDSSQDRVMRDLVMRVFSPFVRGGHGLELGCSDGYMTELLAHRFDALDVVDGCDAFLSEVRNRNLPNVRPIYSLFENFVASKAYDAIFASYILEHVADPQLILAMARVALKPQGLLFVVVPNASALSRQLARHMRLINELTELTENDVKHGHRRVYDRTTLNRELERAGLRSVAQGGILLKILADFQMAQLIDTGVLGPAQIDGLFELGLEHPHLCGSLFSICEAK